MVEQEHDDGALTAAALSRLLDRLDRDRDRAAIEYERLRKALVRFFDWRGTSAPDECADEALDRLARRLEDTRVDDVRGYALGIARLVLLERRRHPAFAPIDEDMDRLAAAGSDRAAAETSERLHACLDDCLCTLPADDHLLLVGYYEGRGGDKIANRKRLASTLALSDNALRSRVQRLRDKIERCVRRCIDR